MGSCCCSLILRRRRRRRLFVMLLLVIDSFVAALAACLCVWLIGSARHGTTATAMTRHACVCLAARVGRLWRTSAWARADGAFVFRSCRLVGGCLGFGRFARSLVSVASALLRDGWARVGGWVGRWVGAGGNAVCSRYFVVVVVVVVADVCGCRPPGLGV
jgi:hypothetical protein